MCKDYDYLSKSNTFCWRMPAHGFCRRVIATCYAVLRTNINSHAHIAKNP